MKKRILIPIALLLTAAFLATWLWLGIVQDPEFSEYSLFIKHHPTFKVHFYSPLGESDMRIEDLPADKQAEERAYRRYVMGEE